jgi:hypothetical protein
MATKLYGASDDLIEFDGDISDEVGGGELPRLVVFDDGTVAQVSYGKPQGGIWRVDVITKGPRFDRVDICDDEDADPYSDVLHLKDGAKCAWVASEWERVK